MSQIWLRSDRRECNASMTIAKCTKLRHPATLATIFLERPSLGSLVVRLITGDPIGISGDEYLCVAIREVVRMRLERMSLAGRPLICLFSPFITIVHDSGFVSYVY